MSFTFPTSWNNPEDSPPRNVWLYSTSPVLQLETSRSGACVGREGTVDFVLKNLCLCPGGRFNRFNVGIFVMRNLGVVFVGLVT